MIQGLCWLVARLAGLALVVESGPERVTLIYGKACPAWARRCLTMCLRMAGHMKPGEVQEVAVGNSGTGKSPARLAARLRVSRRGFFRAEFASGSVSRFRALVIREAADFAQIKAWAGARGD